MEIFNDIFFKIHKLHLNNEPNNRIVFILKHTYKDLPIDEIFVNNVIKLFQYEEQHNKEIKNVKWRTSNR